MKNSQTVAFLGNPQANVSTVLFCSPEQEKRQLLSTANEVCVSALLLPFYLQDRRSPLMPGLSSRFYNSRWLWSVVLGEP
jgi:hypothetical protein